MTNIEAIIILDSIPPGMGSGRDLTDEALGKAIELLQLEEEGAHRASALQCRRYRVRGRG